MYTKQFENNKLMLKRHLRAILFVQTEFVIRLKEYIAK